jgi:DHA1 family bicyclomycin/chloramphenicol resistance-like MFS transporter
MPGRVSFTLMLMLLLAAQPIATDLYLPALPAIARDLGPATSSLTLFVLVFGFGQLINGQLADRFGRRPVLLAGLALYALASLAAAFSPSVMWLATCRGAQGLAMAAIVVCLRAAVRDLHDAGDGPRIMAKGMSGLGVVAMLAPVIGAWVVHWLSWRWALGCMALYGVGVYAVCFFSFAETQRAGHTTLSGSILQVFASRSFWAWTAISTMAYSGIFCFLLLSSTVYVQYLGLSTLAYGWVPASGSFVYVCSTIFCRKLLRKRTPVRAVQIASLFSVAGCGILVAACLFAPSTVWPLLLGHWVFALGHGIHQPCSQAGAVGDFPRLAGRAVAWSGFITMAVAFGVGQTAVRFIDANHSNGAWPMVVPMAISALLLFAISWFWLPRILRA